MMYYFKKSFVSTLFEGFLALNNTILRKATLSKNIEIRDF